MVGLTSMGGVKNIWGSNIYYCTFILFISLETANTQKSAVLLLRVSSVNVNASLPDILKFTISVLEINF